MLKASETLKAKSCSILRQTLKQYHPLATHDKLQPGVDALGLLGIPSAFKHLSVFLSCTVLYLHRQPCSHLHSIYYPYQPSPPPIRH
jgi:hypothetical protein